MSEILNNVHGEFWRPPVQVRESSEDSRTATAQPEICPHCNSGYVTGARFCYVCGAERAPELESQYPGQAHRWLNFQLIRNALGLTVGSLVAFVVGIACALAAIATGFIYTASTVLDWQAVQVWRIEWLLASVAAFLAGILLKRASA